MGMNTDAVCGRPECEQEGDLFAIHHIGAALFEVKSYSSSLLLAKGKTKIKRSVRVYYGSLPNCKVVLDLIRKGDFLYEE